MDTISSYFSVRTVLIICILPPIGYLAMSWIFRKSPKALPPGPREWSIHWKILKASLSGMLPQLATEYARKYGPITFVPSLGQPLVLLNTVEITRKLLASDKYKYLLADRSVIAAFQFAGFKGRDIIFCDYDADQKKKRRLFHSLINLYGHGVEKFETVVWAQLERMFTEIDQTQEQDTDITLILSRTLKMIVYMLAMGEYPEDITTPDILEEYDLALNTLMKPDVDFVLQYLPFVTMIPGKYKRAVARLKKAKKQADTLIYYNQKMTHRPGEPRGIADLLLDYGQKPGYECVNSDEDRVAFLTSIFLAAHLTSRSSVIGMFLCLLNYPETVNRIQKEIDCVIGSKQPKIEYKTSMPYTEAVILETLRIISPLPLSGFRVPSEDIEFEGMIIPKNSLVMMNNWYFLHDENIWEDPWTFKPERFLDSEGNLLPLDHPRRQNMNVFGAGVRMCPGEIFSRSRMFLIVTSILQRYSLLPPTTEKLMPAEFRTPVVNLQGIVHVTPPFKCRLIRRNGFAK